MPPSIKTLIDAQPAIILTTALAYVCSDERWPIAAAAFAALQVGVMLLALWKQRLHHPYQAVRFVARAVAAPSPLAAQPTHPMARRPHLHLVP